MKTLIRTLMLFVCTLFFITGARSQQLSNMGKDFWIGYGHHVRMVNNAAVPEQMQLYITSDVATSGKVSITGIGFEQTFQVVPKKITTINIPRAAALTGDGLYNLGIHVTAEKPVVVYSFIFVSAESGATLCLPSNTLGRDYYSVNFTQASNAANCSSYFFVVAADTGTTSVEITPSAITKSGRAAGVPFVVQLGQGQAYQVLGSVNGLRGADLTGSRIRTVNAGSGCKKIAVFSGSSKISIGCTNPNTSDNLYQQVYPTAAWGQKYIALSSLRNPNNYFRIIRPDPTAVVKVNNQVIPSNAFTNNFYYQFAGNSTYKIESDKAILVAQYFPTQRCLGNTETGDPEMIFLNPVNQTLKNVTLNSMQPNGVNIKDHYLNIVIANTPAALSSFRLDGAAVTGFQPLPADSSFAYARIRTEKGTHNLDCDSGFNVIAYGFGEAESYGYSGGARLRNLYQFAAVQNEYATLDYAATCAGAPFRLSMTFPYQPQTIRWRFGGVMPDVDVAAPQPDSVWRTNGTLVYRYTIPGWLKAPPEGVYNVKLIVSNGTGDGCTVEEEIEHELLVHTAAKAAFSLQTNGCFGDSVFIKEGYTAKNYLQVMRWLWNFGNGDTAMRPQPLPSYKAAGSYNVSFAVINEIGVITDTAFGVAAIHPLPVTSFATGAPFCTGAVINFKNATSVASGSIAISKWTFGDSSMHTVTNLLPALHVFNNPGSYTVTLQTSTDKGCTAAPVTKTITVSAVPKAKFLLPGSCLRDPYSQFTDSSAIAGGGRLRYSWSFGDTAQPSANTDTVQHPKHRYSHAGSFPVRLVVSSQEGCADTLVQVLTVNGSVPQAALELANGARQCSDLPIVVMDQSKTDIGNLTRMELYWDYYGDRQNMISVTNPTAGTRYQILPPVLSGIASKQTTIRMVAYSGQSCFDVAEKVVTTDAVPQLRFDSLPVVCSADKPFLITAASVVDSISGSGIFSGEAVNSQGEFEPARARAGANKIQYSFKSQWGCTAAPVTKTITVSAVPKAKFLLPGSCLRDPYSQFTDSSAIAGGGRLRYSWSFGDTAQPSANTDTVQHPKHRYSHAGSFPVRLVVSSQEGCADTLVQVLTVNGSVPQAALELANGARQCSDLPIVVMDQSKTDIGNLTRMELYWDYYGDRQNMISVTNPTAGTRYQILPPVLSGIASKQTTIRMVAYSGQSCFDVAEKVVTTDAVPQLRFDSLPVVCSAGKPFLITAASVVNGISGSGIFSGEAVNSQGEFEPARARAGANKIQYLFKSQSGCSAEISRNIVVAPSPRVDAGPDLLVRRSRSETIKASSSDNNLTYKWSPATGLSSPTLLQPLVRPLADQVYRLTATTPEGCTATDEMQVQAPDAVYIPNSFTPNGDGVNDSWRIPFLMASDKAYIQIFNRDGMCVYTSNGIAEWNGKFKGTPMPIGTYVYMVKLHEDPQVYKGTLTLIR